LWPITNAKGQLCMLKVSTYPIPKSYVHPLSTTGTSLLQAYPDEKITVESDKLTLIGVPSKLTKGSIINNLNPSNNLLISIVYQYDDITSIPKATNSVSTTVNELNMSLTTPEKELLRWRYRLGYIGFCRIQIVMRSGVLTTSTAQYTKLQMLAARSQAHSSAQHANLARHASKACLDRRQQWLVAEQAQFDKATYFQAKRSLWITSIAPQRDVSSCLEARLAMI
jgi:hypothetical protein